MTPLPLPASASALTNDEAASAASSGLRVPGYSDAEPAFLRDSDVLLNVMTPSAAADHNALLTRVSALRAQLDEAQVEVRAHRAHVDTVHQEYAKLEIAHHELVLKFQQLVEAQFWQQKGAQ